MKNIKRIINVIFLLWGFGLGFWIAWSIPVRREVTVAHANPCFGEQDFIDSNWHETHSCDEPISQPQEKCLNSGGIFTQTPSKEYEGEYLAGM